MLALSTGAYAALRVSGVSGSIGRWVGSWVSGSDADGAIGLDDVAIVPGPIIQSLDENGLVVAQETTWRDLSWNGVSTIDTPALYGISACQAGLVAGALSSLSSRNPLFIGLGGLSCLPHVQAISDTEQTVVSRMSLRDAGTNLSVSPTFIKAFGGAGFDNFYDAQPTSDGGYVAVGYTDSVGSPTGYCDGFILKVDALGNREWTKELLGNNLDYSQSIYQNSDGGYISAGRSNSCGTMTGYVGRLDSAGGKLWLKCANSGYVLNYIKQTSDGGYIAAGQVANLGSGYTKGVLIAKLNSTGSIFWKKEFGATDNVNRKWSNTIALTSDGGCIVGGSYGNDAAATNSVALIFRLNAAGTKLWAKTFGAFVVGQDDTILSIQQTSDGGCIIAGVYYFGTTANALIMKLTSDGTRDWAKRFGDANVCTAYAVRQTSDGGYIVAGTIDASKYAFFLLKLDSTGIALWAKTFQNMNISNPRSIYQTDDKGFIIAAETSSVGAGSVDALLIRLDANATIKTGCGGQSLLWQTTEIIPTESPLTWTTQDAGLILTDTNDLTLSDWALTTTPICSQVPPTITAVSKLGTEDVVMTFSLSDFVSHFSDVDGDSLTQIQITSLPGYGTLKLSSVAVALSQEVLVGNLGSLTFTPTLNFNGQTSFTWKGYDGTAYSLASSSVNITIINGIPVVTSISKLGEDNSIMSFNATDFTSHFNDVDGDSLTQIQVTSLPAHGTLKLSSTGVIINQEIPLANLGTLTFVPNTGWTGQTSFTWKGYDGTDYSTTAATVNLTIFHIPDIGEEFRVNTYTVGDQTSPVVAGLIDGKFAVAWESRQDGDGIGIYSQIYNVDRSVNLTEFRANIYNTSNQALPSITGLTNGKFAITWESYGQDGDSWGIYAKVYNSDGSVSKNDFLVNTFTTGYQYFPSIANLRDGKFVITWSSYPHQVGDVDGHGIYGQIFNVAGDKYDLEFLVNNQYTKGDQHYSAVTVLSDGKFVVTWASDGQDGDGFGIYAKVYNPDGSVSKNDFLVNTHTIGDQLFPAIRGLSNGNFVVSWGSQDGDSDGVYSKIFYANGTACSSEFLTNTYTVGIQNRPVISLLDSDKFVTLWRSYGQDGDSYGVYGQVYYANGNIYGPEFRVNTYTSGQQDFASVAPLSDAKFVVVWESNGQAGTWKNYAKICSANPILETNTLTIAEGQVVALSIANLYAKTGCGLDKSPLTFTPSAVLNGEFKFNNATTASFTMQNILDGRVTFTHNGGEEEPSYMIRVSDGNAAGASVAANIIFTKVNDAPLVSAISMSGLENGSINFAASDFSSQFTDVDGDSLARIQITSLPTHGTLKLGSNTVTLNQEIPAANLGSLTFTPDPYWNGATSFTWKGYDGTVYSTAAATVNLTITAVNYAPLVSAISMSGLENGSVNFTVSDFSRQFTDVDGDSLAKIQITSLPTHGTLKLGSNTVTLNQEIPAANLGSLTFTPDPYWNGATSFTWKGHDGTVYSTASATVNLTITAVNYAPVVSAVSKDRLEDTAVNFTKADFTSQFTDVDGDSLTRVQITSLPMHGTLKLGSNIVTLNQEISVSLLDSLTFNPPSANWNGATSFTWKGYDGTVYSTASATVNITVAPVNDPPVAYAITKSGAEDAVMSFNASDFTSHFSDIDGDSLAGIKITSLPLPSYGVLQLKNVAVVLDQGIDASDLGKLTFVPTQYWHGQASFSWEAYDGASYSNPATVTLTITSINHAPTLNATLDSQTSCCNAAKGQAFSFTFATNTFADIDGDVLTYSAKLSDGSTLPSWLTFNSVARRLSGTPPVSGNFDIKITATDGGGLSVSDTFTLTVSNAAPVLVNHQLTLKEGETITVTSDMLSATDADDSANSLAFTVSNVQRGYFARKTAGTTSIDSFTQGEVVAGNIQFVHDGSEVKPSFSISVSDGVAAPTTPVAGVVNYTPVNDAPTINVALATQTGCCSVAKGQQYSFTFTANTFSDRDAGDTLTYSPALSDDSALPSWLTLITRTFSGTPTTSGTLHLKVTATDSGGLSVSDAFNLVISNVCPELGNNQVMIKQGEKITVTSDMLSATDSDDLADNLVFKVVSPQHCWFELVSNPGTPIPTFTQRQVTLGQVKFAHDGTINPPNYKIQVSDGICTSAAKDPSPIDFIPVQITVSGSGEPPPILPTVAGIVGAVGGTALAVASAVGIWFLITSKKRASRVAHPFAEELRKASELSCIDNFNRDYYNFSSNGVQNFDFGASFLKFAEYLKRALQARGVEIIEMRSNSKFNLKTLNALAKVVFQVINECQDEEFNTLKQALQSGNVTYKCLKLITGKDPTAFLQAGSIISNIAKEGFIPNSAVLDPLAERVAASWQSLGHVLNKPVEAAASSSQASSPAASPSVARVVSPVAGRTAFGQVHSPGIEMAVRSPAASPTQQPLLQGNTSSASYSGSATAAAPAPVQSPRDSAQLGGSQGRDGATTPGGTPHRHHSHKKHHAENSGSSAPVESRAPGTGSAAASFSANPQTFFAQPTRREEQVPTSAPKYGDSYF